MFLLRTQAPFLAADHRRDTLASPPGWAQGAGGGSRPRPPAPRSRLRAGAQGSAGCAVPSAAVKAAPVQGNGWERTGNNPGEADGGGEGMASPASSV